MNMKKMLLANFQAGYLGFMLALAGVPVSTNPKIFFATLLPVAFISVIIANIED